MDANRKLRVHATTRSAPTHFQALPTFQQCVAVALARADAKLGALIQQRIEDPDWNGDDVYVDLGVETALGHVRRMRGEAFKDFNEFSAQWYQAMAVVKLAQPAFSRPHSVYGSMLDGACAMFDQLGDMIDFICLNQDIRQSPELRTQ